MKTKETEYIATEEAVARFINLHYIPSAYSLLDVTDGHWLESEENHQKAIDDRLAEKEITRFKCYVDVCKNRHQLAVTLTAAIESELRRPDGALKTAVIGSSAHEQIDWESLQDWVDDRFGITVVQPRVVEVPVAGSTEVIDKEAKEERVDYSPKLKAFIGRGIGGRKAVNFLATLSFAVDAYARQKKAMYIKSDGQINVNLLAKEISAIAANATKSGTLPGQSPEAIKDRVEVAIEARKYVLSR